MSINKASGFRLKTNESEIIRRNLNNHLTKSGENFNFEKISNSKDLKDITIKILRCPNYSDSNPTILYKNYEFIKPHILIIDELVISFNLKNRFSQLQDQLFFNLNDFINLAENININGIEKILVIDDVIFKDTMKLSFLMFGELRIKKMDALLNMLHKHLGGYSDEIYPDLRQEIFDNYNEKVKKIGRRNNLEHFKSSIYEVMKKYTPKY